MKYLKRFNESIKNDNDAVINKILKFVNTSYFINKSSIFADNFKPNKVETFNFVCNGLDITIHNKGGKQILIIRDNLGEKHIRNTIVNHAKLKELFYSVLKIYVYKQLVNTLVKELKLSKHDVIERVEEFEIIKNNEITGESHLDLISLRSLFDFYNLNYDSSEYIFESVSNKSDIDELLSYVDTDEFFKRTQIYVDRESGEAEVSFMYDDKNIIMKYLKRFNESVNNPELLLHEILEVLKDDNFLLSGDINIYERTTIHPSGKSFLFKFKYKDIRMEIGKFPRLFCILYNNTMDMANFGEYMISPDLNLELYNLLLLAFDNNDVLNRYLVTRLDISKKEAIERAIEFDVIKNDKIDSLSLNSLFDYYNKPYNDDDTKSYFNYRNIPIS